MPLAAGNFSSIQTAADFDFNSLRPKPKRFLHCLAHGAPKRNTLLELSRNLLSLQLRVQFRLMNLLNRNQHFAAGFLGQITFQLVDFRALASDDDAGTRRVNNDLQTIGGALNVHMGNSRPGEALLEIPLQPQVFNQELAILLLGEPVRVPVLVVTEAKSVRVNFL